MRRDTQQKPTRKIEKKHCTASRLAMRKEEKSIYEKYGRERERERERERLYCVMSCEEKHAPLKGLTFHPGSRTTLVRKKYMVAPKPPRVRTNPHHHDWTIRENMNQY
jgi:hypothetical protein